MRGRLMVLGGAVLVAALVGAVLVAPSFADEPTPTPEAKCDWRGWGFGLWGRSWAVFDAAAEALGLAPEGLFTELHSSKTLDEVAGEKGIGLEAVQEAMKSARVEAAKEAIEQAVADGRLTREQADWLLEGLELGFPLKGGRFGARGWGRGRRR